MIVCRSCHAEAHPLHDGYYATGCDCVPLELVPLRDTLSPALASAWDLYLQAVNARDIAIENAREQIERHYRDVISLRMQAFMDAAKREKQP